MGAPGGNLLVGVEQARGLPPAAGISAARVRATSAPARKQFEFLFDF